MEYGIWKTEEKGQSLAFRFPFYVLLFSIFHFPFSILNAQNIDPIREKRQSSRGKQVGQEMNLPNYESKKFHFGFFLAINYARFNVSPSSYFNQQLTDTAITTNPIRGIEPVPAPGFTTGFIINMRIFDQLEVRLLPTVSFYQRYVEFYYSFDTLQGRIKPATMLNQSTFSFIELPILLKYKSVRRKNSRMFVTGGLKPGFEVGAKKKEIDPSLLRAESIDLAIEYGFGIDLYYPLFKFSPEIRFSHGLFNMRVNDDNPFAKSLQRMTSHTVTFYLNFN